jgi:hypothetical protein
MASTPSLFIRILQAVIHRVWTVLFFLSVFSVATLVNHWWDAIVSAGLALQGLATSALDLFRQ